MATAIGLTEHIDVEEALQCNIFHGRITKQGKKSPDFLFWQGPMTDRSHIYLVECKGTMASLSQSYNQLCAGTVQLPAIKSIKNPIALVVSGVCLLEKRTVINVIDPPIEENGENSYIVEEPDAFYKQITKLSFWKKLVYAFPGGAVFLKTGKFGSINKREETVLVPKKHVTFYGNREIMFSNGFCIEVFRGIYSGFMEKEDYPGSFDEWFGKFYQEYPGRYEDWQGLFEELVSVFGSGHERKYPGALPLLIRKTVRSRTLMLLGRC